MYNFDSLALKFFTEENAGYLSGASVQKIQQPSRKELIFSLRNSLPKNSQDSKTGGGENRKLYINIDPKYPHLCFIASSKDGGEAAVEGYSKRGIKIPQHPPMFCMQLRKYLDGARIQEVRHVEYERILELYFNHVDEIGQVVSLCLAIELMGKHSNVILYNSRSKVILGSMHNISPEKSSVREVYGGIGYIYPPEQYKTDILKTSYGAFSEALKSREDTIKAINGHYYYLSIPLIEKSVVNCADSAETFTALQKLVSGEDKSSMYSILGGGDSINSALCSYFEDIMFKDLFDKKSKALKKVIQKELKRLEGVVKSKQSDGKMKQYKQKGDLILQYIYKINPRDEYLEVEGLKIELDNTKTPSENAQRYFTLYQKAKNAQNVHSEMLEAALESQKYYEGLLFDAENSKTLEELDQITLGEENEKTQKETLQIEKINEGDWEIYIGKNNKQNDYLISKIARGEDFWFHAKDFPSSHVILKTKTPQKEPPDKLLLMASKIVKENSPLKNTAKASIIYTKRKYLKKPPGAKLGYVTYREEKEIVV